MTTGRCLRLVQTAPVLWQLFGSLHCVSLLGSACAMNGCDGFDRPDLNDDRILRRFRWVVLR